MHKIYVYGTLRPNKGETMRIPGSLFNVGWFPAAINIGNSSEDEITVETILASDDKLRELDCYEGYDPEDPLNSLYIRKKYLDGYIYEYNRPLTGLEKIPSGDWFNKI